VPLVHAVVGQRLRAIRRIRRLSQDRLAARAGLSGKFIGEVERGEKSISVDSLYRLAAALGVSIGYLTDVRGPTTGEAETVIAMLMSLSRAERRQAYAVLHAALSKSSG
jgi:transcriptional regulator with XRE-family HTH domain